MMRKKVLILIVSLLFFNVVFSSMQDEYFENMITLRVGNYLKQDFYPVISNFNGEIYIDIDDFFELTELSQYTKFSRKDEGVKLVMEGTLFFDMKERYIRKNIKDMNCIEIDGKLYIEMDSLDKLLPLKQIKWIEEEYTLEIYPDFNLPIEYRVACERRKHTVEDSKIENSLSKETDMFMKSDRKLIDLGMLKIRYDIDDIGGFYKKGEEKDRGDIEAEYSSQLLYGDFSIRHNLYSTGELEDISLKYPYLLKNKTVTIGDNFIIGNDILDYDNKIRGISISENNHNVKRSGRKITIDGKAPKNSTVEIYQNGKIVDYQNVKGNDYTFTLEMRSQSDKFQIKIYDRNGVFLEKKNINIMEGSGFLTKGDWDYNFFYGQNPQGKNKTWDDLKYGISYGLSNNFSYSFDYYDTKNEKKIYKYIKHKGGYRFSNLPIPLITNFSYYNSFGDSSEGYITELKTEILSQKLYYIYENYKDILASDEGKDYYHEAEISGNYDRLDYFFRISNKNYMKEVEEKYKVGLSYDITKNIRIDLDLGNRIKREKKIKVDYTGNIGIDYGRGDFTYSFDADYDRERYYQWKYKCNIRKRLGKNTRYSYKVEVDYNRKDLFRFGVGFEYKFNDFFKMDYDYDSQRKDMNKIGASFEKVVNIKKPLTQNNSKASNKGYVEGVIFIDANGNGKKEIDEDPLKGVGVGIGNNLVKTNKNGMFYLCDISPYRKNKLVYNYSNIIIDPTLRTDNYQEIEVIPASGKKIKVGLVPLSMIMGSIHLPDIDMKKRNKFFSYVEIILEKDGNYYDSFFPEYDGFFAIQDLKPGRYSLKLNYLGSESINLEKNILEVIVKAGETGNFYEGVDFKVFEIKSKK